jgi:hypothetical protein
MATTKLGDVYPIIIDKYESFVPLNVGVDMIEKINSIVEHLNRLGQLTTETVNQWNKVMKWVNADGLTDSVNAKIDDLISKGFFDTLLVAVNNTLAESTQIKGTTQSIIWNTDGTAQKVQHKDSLNNILREDVFTYSTNLITEVRTLISGDSLTFKYHLDTLQTEVI